MKDGKTKPKPSSRFLFGEDYVKLISHGNSSVIWIIEQWCPTNLGLASKPIRCSSLVHGLSTSCDGSGEVSLVTPSCSAIELKHTETLLGLCKVVTVLGRRPVPPDCLSL